MKLFGSVYTVLYIIKGIINNESTKIIIKIIEINTSYFEILKNFLNKKIPTILPNIDVIPIKIESTTAKYPISRNYITVAKELKNKHNQDKLVN